MSGQIDDSLYPKPPQGNGALDTASKYVGLRNAILQGQQQQQQLQLGGQQLQAGQIGINQAQLDLTLKHYGAISGLLTPLLGRKEPLTQRDVLEAASTGIQMGLFDAKQAAAELAHMPQDDAGIRRQLQELVISAQDNATRLQALMPSPGAVGLGGQTGLVRTPAYGAPSLDATIANTLPPTTTAVQPDLSTRYVGSQAPATTGNITTAPSPTGGASAAPAPTQTGVMAAPQPGAAEAIRARSELSAHQSNALQLAADSIPTQKTLLANLSQSLNHFTSGPGAEIIKRGQTLFNELTGAKLGAAEIAAQDSFIKQSTQLAQQQLAQLGTGTDAKLESAIHTNPSDFLSNMSNKEIIALLQGNLDATSAKWNAWQKYAQAHGPTSYGDFQTEFNAHFDPRMFQMMHLPAKNRKEILGDMTKPERERFLDDFAYAENQGWINRKALGQ